MEWPNMNFGPATNQPPPPPDQAISPKGTRHTSLEPVIPTGQEILAQLNQLTEEYALSGGNSTIGGGRERTNVSDSRQESSSSEDEAQSSAQSSETVDDNNIATSLHQLTPPRPAPPTPVSYLAPPALEPPSALMPPTTGPSISVAEAPVSSRLRTRPEKSQKWKDSMRIGPQQEKGQPTKSKAPKETQEPAKRTKTGVENTTTTTTKRVAARSAGARSRKNKHQDLKFKAATRVEFPNLIIPNTTSSSSVAAAEQSKAGANSIENGKKHQATVPEPSKSAAAVKVTAKKAVPKNVAAKKRAREEDGEDKEDGRTSPIKRLRVTKVLKAPKSKKIINHAPTRKLDVFVCGEGHSGELGLGNAITAIDVKRPRLNHNLSSSKVGVVHIAVGGMHAAALTHDGLIYTWGSNNYGALGRDTKWDRSTNDEMGVDYDEAVNLNPLESTPMPIPSEHFPSNIVFTQLACGDNTTFALTDDGEVWGWGTFRSNDGILGFSKDVNIQSAPAKLPNLSNVKKVVCGANHAMALREDGKVFIWGSGEQNQLGHRVLERKRHDSLIPTALRLNKKCRLIGCGIDHSFAVEKSKEDVWTWGLNSFGETGIREADGSNQAVIFSPVRVPTLSFNGDTISSITGGSHHSAATTANGKLLVWGRLDGHQLGMNPNSLPDAELIKDISDQPRILIQPTELPITAIGTAKFVAVGHDHNIAINTDGQAYSWGFNANHQCGQGSSSGDIDEPTRIDNTAVRNRQLIWAGCGGEFSIVAAVAEGENEAE